MEKEKEKLLSKRVARYHKNKHGTRVPRVKKEKLTKKKLLC